MERDNDQVTKLRHTGKERLYREFATVGGKSEKTTRTINLLFGITTVVILLQLLLGGLLTFNFINVGVHIVVGILTLILAIVTMIVVVVSKPRLRLLLIASIALVLLIVLQIILGFDTLNTGSQTVAWIHFVNAMAIYGVAMSGTFVASKTARPEKPLVGAK